MEGLKTILTLFVLLRTSTRGEAQLPDPIDINELGIQLANGSAPNEGRVLIRWSPDSPWTALCYSPFSADTVSFQMCRKLGYPFACGHGEAGTRRTFDSSLVNITSVDYLTVCSVHQTNVTAGGCSLFPIPQLDPSHGLSCSHDRDWWLTCGYAGMPDFELRLVEGAVSGPTELLQGRCGGAEQWGAICSNRFYELRAGKVACRDLRLSDDALSTRPVPFGEVSVHHQPNYTLFVDIGCIGSEASLTECQHYSLRECHAYATLECFTEIREYRETAYLCGSKQLCGDQCQQIHPVSGNFDDIFHYCQCDDACVLFDDCCYDHAAACNPGVPSLERGGFTADRFGCVWVPGSQFTHVGYVAVDRCPISWTDEGTRELCERAVNVTDIIGSMPVYDEQGVDFKNIFCAVCNGISLGRLARWDVSGSDSFLSPSMEKFYPSLNQSLPSTGWVVTPPLGHAEIRKCSAHLVDVCLEEFRDTEVEEACKAYYAPIRIDWINVRYRNPHCALCNGRELVPENSCRDQVCEETCDPTPWGPCMGVCSPYDDFLTIEVLFDFTSSSSIHGVSCFDDQIYDPFLERCRALRCAAGYRIQGDECVAVDLIPPPFNPVENASAIECLSRRLDKDSAGTQVLTASQIVTMTAQDTAALTVSVLVPSARDALDVEAAFDVAIESSENFTMASQFLCNISQLSIFMPFGLGESGYCNSENGNEVFPGYDGHVFEIVKFQKSTHDEQYTKENLSPLCLKVENLNCSSLLALKDFEYKILSKGILEVVASGIRLSAAEYVIFPDGTAVICPFEGPVPEGLEPQIRRAISFAGSCLSLLALVATFVTYCVFPELRNTAGKSTMNLMVALFVAMLLLLLAGYLRQDHALCLSGAALAHFSWLAAFSWMTVLSVSVARTLTSKVSRPYRRARVDRALIAYMCLAWGIPLVIVSICLILQFCDCTNLPAIYAEGDICWITDASARLVVFVLPVALSLVLNTMLYVFTVISIRRNRQASKAARDEGKVKALGEELSIYLKICALVGVTWVFGFISQSVTGILVFSYIYIILNYLQGVFIFIAFCLNKRVRGLWRQKFRGRGRRPTKTSTSRPKHDTKTTGLSTISHPHANGESTKL